ncbi:MAG: hypothetical protein K9J85_09255 [Desulfobacteraceae bacterium]|nr:hypothetical protein [Desulfobacteraceae bacterium]
MSQSQEPEKTGPKTAAKETPRIETYDGDPRLLIIAPHGFKPKKQNEKRDDINTGEMAELIWNKLKCRVIINSGIKRTEADLNEISGLEKVPEFEDAIKKYADNKTPTLVLWLHGAADTAIKSEEDKHVAFQKTESKGLDAVLGYGQGEPPRLTAGEETVQNLIKALSNNGIKAMPANEELDYFCAHNKDRTSQWFRVQKNKKYDRIQSIQIEIKRGLRQQDKYPGTADKLALALSELTGIEIQDPIAQNKAIAVASNEKDPVDESLVEEAYSELRNILVNHLRKGMLEAGKYLIEKFYDNDVELARQKSSPKKASLNKLKKKLQNSDGNAPSKTWIYDAVNLAVDHHDYANDSVYGKLGHSHQVNLTYVKDPDKKKTLIKETAKNEYTVAKLKKEIAKAKGKKEPVTLGMLRDVEALKKRDLPELQEMDDVTVEIIKNLKSKLTGYEEALKGLKEVIAEKAAQDNEGLEN